MEEFTKEMGEKLRRKGCWVCVIFFPRLRGGRGGGGDIPPFALGARGLGGSPRPRFCAWFCTWFWGTMVFGPLYFVDPVKGTTIMI